MARFPSVGEDFGGYRITRQLGRGGMGVVFAAEQVGLGRTVALKVLSPEFAEQHDYRTRFSREATVLARLDSPHVIQIFDHGEHDGCLYIATQYVAGGDLGEALVKHGPVPVAQAAQVADQLAWALTDSHAAGIVHRDLKPNTFCCATSTPRSSSTSATSASPRTAARADRGRRRRRHLRLPRPRAAPRRAGHRRPPTSTPWAACCAPRSSAPRRTPAATSRSA